PGLSSSPPVPLSLRERGNSWPSFEPRECEDTPHPIGCTIRIREQSGRVREPEQLGQMRHGAPALRAAEHAEVWLVAVQVGEEHDAGFVRMRGSLKDVTRQLHR